MRVSLVDCTSGPVKASGTGDCLCYTLLNRGGREGEREEEREGEWEGWIARNSTVHGCTSSFFGGRLIHYHNAFQNFPPFPIVNVVVWEGPV